MTETFIAAFVDLVEDGRTLLLDVLPRHGRTLTMTMPPKAIYVPMQQHGGNTWQLSYQHEQHNTLAIEQVWLQWLLRDLSWRRAAEAAAELLAMGKPNLPPANWQLRAGGQQITWDIWELNNKEPMSQLLAEFVVAPAWWCLRQFPSIAAPDADIAKATASEVIATLVSGSYKLVYSLPVICALAPESSAETISLRRMSDEELGLEMAAQRRISDEVGWIPQGLPTSHLLEVTASQVDEHASTPLKPLLDVILSLELSGHRIGGPGTVSIRTVPEWTETGVRRTWVRLNPYLWAGPEERVDLVTVEALARKLASWNVESPSVPEERALHRYVMSCSRQDDADAILDLAIALEALFLPSDSDRGAFQLALHGAYWLGQDASSRREAFEQLREMSRTRNGLVHSGKEVTPKQLRASREAAHKLATAALRRAVEERFPKSEYFRRAVLGGIE